MQFGKTRQTFFSAAASSHASCATLSLFFSLMISMITLERQGPLHSTGGNFILVFSRGGAGILISIVGLREGVDCGVGFRLLGLKVFLAFRT